MTHCTQKKKKNEEQILVLLVFRTNPRKWNYEWTSVLKICTALIVGIFERICCFDEVFLMALTSTEQLFIERPLYRLFLHNDRLPYFWQNISLQCYRLYNFLSFRSSHWKCSVRIGVLLNSAKLTGKHLWQSLFFNKVTGWRNCFWSFSSLLLNISCLFRFNRKMRWKKGNALMELKYLLFCSSIDLFKRQKF